MAKFEKFDSRKQIQGLAEAARQIQIEELIRAGKLPSLDQVASAIDSVRTEYQPKILAPRKKGRQALQQVRTLDSR
jgi:hypothetical protein